MTILKTSSNVVACSSLCIIYNLLIHKSTEAQKLPIKPLDMYNILFACSSEKIHNGSYSIFLMELEKISSINIQNLNLECLCSCDRFTSVSRSEVLSGLVANKSIHRQSVLFVFDFHKS